jgi:hypothetical protein
MYKNFSKGAINEDGKVCLCIFDSLSLLVTDRVFVFYLASQPESEEGRGGARGAPVLFPDRLGGARAEAAHAAVRTHRRVGRADDEL